MPRAVLLAFALMFALGACAREPDPRSRATAAEIASAESGEVLAAQTIVSASANTLIDDGLGARIGGLTGVFVGSLFGQGSGRAVGALIGYGVGSIAGAFVENETERNPRARYIIRLDNGEEIIVITQGYARFEPGSAVRVVNRGHAFSVVFAA